MNQRTLIILLALLILASPTLHAEGTSHLIILLSPSQLEAQHQDNTIVKTLSELKNEWPYLDTYTDITLVFHPEGKEILEFLKEHEEDLSKWSGTFTYYLMDRSIRRLALTDGGIGFTYGDEYNLNLGVKPGYNVILANGEWESLDMVLMANASEDRPVLLRGHTPGKVFLTGQSRISIQGSYLTLDGLVFKDGYFAGTVIRFTTQSHHCRLTNSAMLSYNPPLRDTKSWWVNMEGTYNRVDHNFFKGKTTVSPVVTVGVGHGPNYHQIDHNYFAHRPPLGVNGGETIRVGTSDKATVNSRTTVEFNLFEECDGEIEIISNKSSENIYRYNTFIDSAGSLTLRHGDRAIVEGNFFIGNHKPASAGVRIIGQGHRIINNYFTGLTDRVGGVISIQAAMENAPPGGYQLVKDIVIAFNTIVDNKAAAIYFGWGLGSKSGDAISNLPPEDCIIANNLIVKNSPLSAGIKPVNPKWEGNIAHQNGGLSFLKRQEGVLTIDPKLIMGDDGLWRPAANSPIIGAAEGDYPFVSEDIDGQPRGHKKDVGCDEASEGPIKRRPLTPDDVGPQWDVKNIL